MYGCRANIGIVKEFGTVYYEFVERIILEISVTLLVVALFRLQTKFDNPLKPSPIC